MKVYIKNMVAHGTRKFVLSELKKLGLSLKSFEAGELEFSNDLSPSETIALEKSLAKYGLELVTEDSHADLPYSINGNNSSSHFDEDLLSELVELTKAG